MISVCIPTYNGESYIREQLTSILEQLNHCDEVIISDDGSTDNTLKIIDDLKDPRIKVYQNELKSDFSSNIRTEQILKKVSLNVQNALNKCVGDYIYLADQDDIWLDGRISQTINLLKSEKPVLVINDCNIINQNEEITQASYYDYIPPSKSLLRTVVKSSFHGCCMCFNRALLNRAFPFPYYSLGHDLWIGLTAIKYGDVKFVEHCLLSYRRHTMTVTKTGHKSANPLRFKLYYRLMIIIEYLKINNRKK
ncbi:Spore coat polysaccharide biosynthesis protein spsA [Cedecea lapagei]|uniref:Spore coat polysaccharide biosynthesis protein spsA n=1 Tax=Cedecea lapagei TaxID=158823 RepID=A0A447V078_9ENTR|nr:glycosyltransferase [Cedecea lapagei]VEB96366.1 Spore coat polysaccharide biosynthesis protein spsA [Cedecea lapagei]